METKRVAEVGKNKVEGGRPLWEVRRDKTKERRSDGSLERAKIMSKKGSLVKKNIVCLRDWAKEHQFMEESKDQYSHPPHKPTVYVGSSHNGVEVQRALGLLAEEKCFGFAIY